ncbi:MAG: class I SAM-dependent methyltransferase [Pseudomonadales bacterium]
MAEIRTLTQVPCPLCNCAEHKILFQTKDYRQRVSDDAFTVSRCLECGAGYLSLRPTEEDLPRYYDEHFYWSFENDESARDSRESLLRNRQSQIRAKARWLSHLSPGRLLDIGTMKGEFIYHMASLGWDCEGVEFSRTPPNLFNMPIHYGDFLEMQGLPDSGYDCITLWAVLEHIYRPAEYIEKISRLLKPGGQLVLLVTNFNTLQARFFEMDDYPRHLNLFTKKSVRTLLQRHGLSIDRVSTDQSVFGGHLQGGFVYLCKRLCGYSRGEALSEWKSDATLIPFFHQWRGRGSRAMRAVAFADRILLSPIEKLLDSLGFGFTLTIVAKKATTATTSAK